MILRVDWGGSGLPGTAEFGEPSWRQAKTLTPIRQSGRLKMGTGFERKGRNRSETCRREVPGVFSAGRSFAAASLTKEKSRDNMVWPMKGVSKPVHLDGFR